MSDVDQIMSEFAEAYERDGAADPREYLQRVEGLDRKELRLLIEGFLGGAERQRWDAGEYRGSLAERAVAGSGFAEAWPTLLPELRMRARVSRSALVKRLAAAIGFPGSEKRVGDYYHRMEHGDLAPSGVSTFVLEKLGEIVGTTAAALRSAGEAAERPEGAGSEVFARLGSGMASPATVESVMFESAAADTGPEDELDRLFTGGD